MLAQHVAVFPWSCAVVLGGVGAGEEKPPVSAAKILLVLAVSPHPSGNIESGNTKTPADPRAAIPLLCNQLDSVLLELFSVIWTFSFLAH